MFSEMDNPLESQQMNILIYLYADHISKYEVNYQQYEYVKKDQL